ncbi:MAG: ankyrin repeat protein [Rickettsiales bacterium]|jgi:ankyrin repeat protein
MAEKINEQMEDDIFLGEVTKNSPLIEACYENEVQTVEKILDLDNSEINFKTGSGDTALHIAAQNGYLELVIALLTRGADVNLLTSNGWTALHFAAQRGYLEVVKILIRAKVNVNAQGIAYHRTALHYAADQGRTLVAKELIKAGADLNLIDKQDLTALDVAARKSYLDIVELLKVKS